MTMAKGNIQAFVIAVFFAVVGVCTLGAPADAQTASLPGPSIPVTTAPAPTSDVPQAAPMTMPTPTAGAGITDEHYHLGPGDKLRVTVFGEDDLSGEYSVDGSGQVQLPLVGQVKAAGLTIHEFVAEADAAFENGYLKDPKISVEVENYRPFYIMGEVNKPGEYPYENGLTVLGAIALAGGYTYRADDSDVYIRRAGSTKEVVLPVDSTTKIAPGDIVRIAERIF
jgi:protein involved in polysaccharide export with SLBB domain